MDSSPPECNLECSSPSRKVCVRRFRKPILSSGTTSLGRNSHRCSIPKGYSALARAPALYYRSRSSPSANLKSVPWGGAGGWGLGAGAGAGVGHELRRILFEKESLAPFVGKSLKPTRLAFNKWDNQSPRPQSSIYIASRMEKRPPVPLLIPN